ncbi:CPSF3 protein [Capsaspora owczarzaki ATCC 30864]|uniref:CPSF3 protein n=1 Tax=Capsaspora owczarzaki (strain ATCC 30864) TaxID=595528 RepID=UPI0003522EAF|nr:CPSF3 protein [Capsaspora owczarzaki ATCC 30864]|eukprot:XP_004365619.2 CPSF3 protein [Capsaspora owczarzaki ATCC 30864]
MSSAAPPASLIAGAIPTAVPGLSILPSKRKADGDPPLESDLMILTPLGAGQEVGRSCFVLQFKGKTIMFDCGLHPAYSGQAALPFFDSFDPGLDSIDVLLVTHAGVPYIMTKTNFKGRVFMTHPTKAIYKWMVADFIRVSNVSADEMLFNERDIDNTMARIETIDYHQEKEVNGIKFWCYNAGHVLGACMFMVEIAGVKLLYTGDYSRHEDRHLMPAEIPTIAPDVLCVESTYGVRVHEPRVEREGRFTKDVHDIVMRGGKCLLPVFALGRAQELLLILDEFWESKPALHNIPIYYASSLARKCMAIYQTYINQMNERIRRQFAISNPFMFKHIASIKSASEIDQSGPMVMMASPGMLQNGLSRDLFEQWCPDSRNGVIVTGYSVEGTLAKSILSAPKEVPSLTGQKLPLRMSVTYVSFSAHADFAQTSEFIDALKPPHIVLVHGEATEMGRLKAALTRKYEDHAEIKIEVHTPANAQSVQLYFRGERMAKAIGSLAATQPEDLQAVSGVLVKRGFTHQLMAPGDITEFTELKTSVVRQRLCVAYRLPFSLLQFYLEQMYGNVKPFDQDNSPSLLVFETVTVIQRDSTSVVLEWVASAVNDMIADSVLAVLLQIESNPQSVKLSQSSHSHGDSHNHAMHDDSDSDMSTEASKLNEVVQDVFGRNPDQDEEQRAALLAALAGEDEPRVEWAICLEAFLREQFGEVDILAPGDGLGAALRQRLPASEVATAADDDEPTDLDRRVSDADDVVSPQELRLLVILDEIWALVDVFGKPATTSQYCRG